MIEASENMEDKWITGNIVLRIGGHPLEMEMTVPAAPVKPQRMLPVIQNMTNSIVDLSVKAVEEAGRKISCKAGCDACCHHVVPLSEIEIYQIAQLVEEMPEPRRSEIKKRFSDAVEHFTKMNWFDELTDLTSLSMPDDPDYIPTILLQEAMRYFREGIPCPFLENGTCSIRESRPLACREYLVTSPAVNCSNPTSETINKVPLLMKPGRALRLTGRTGKLEHCGVLPLIRALELADQYPESFETKTGDRWIAEIFEHMTGSDIPEESSKPTKPTRSRKRIKKRSK